MAPHPSPSGRASPGSASQPRRARARGSRVHARRPADRRSSARAPASSPPRAAGRPPSDVATRPCSRGRLGPRRREPGRTSSSRRSRGATRRQDRARSELRDAAASALLRADPFRDRERRPVERPARRRHDRTWWRSPRAVAAAARALPGAGRRWPRRRSWGRCAEPGWARPPHRTCVHTARRTALAPELPIRTEDRAWCSLVDPRSSIPSARSYGVGKRPVRRAQAATLSKAPGGRRPRNRLRRKSSAPLAIAAPPCDELRGFGMRN